MPYPKAERLVKLMAANFRQQPQWEYWNRSGVPLADFREWQAQSQSFEEMALYTSASGYRTTADDDSRYLLGSRVSLNLFSMLGTHAALVLAVTGIYGTLWLTVNQRTHELGLRRALGAQDGDVLRLVLRQGAGLVLAGSVLGLLGAWGLTRFIRGWLVEVSPTDPLTVALVTAVLLLAALLACYVPARRAVQLDPLAALRSE